MPPTQNNGLVCSNSISSTTQPEDVRNHRWRQLSLSTIDADRLLFKDIPFYYNTSVRLKTALLTAAAKDLLPYKTVEDYVASGRSSSSIASVIRNIGAKTAIEIESIIDEYLTSKYGTLNPELSTGNEQKLEEGYHPDAFRPICESVGAFELSTRLYNVLNRSCIDGTFPFGTISDYWKSGSTRKARLREVRGLGKTAADEFDEIAVSILNGRQQIELIANNEIENEASNHAEQLMIQLTRRLTDRQFSVLWERSRGRKFHEIASQLGSSKQRVSQIERKARGRIASDVHASLDIYHQELARLLDEHSGEVEIESVCEATSLSEEELKLVLYILRMECRTEIILTEGVVFRKGSLDSHPEWRSRISSTLRHLNLPLRLDEIVIDCSDIPRSFVRRKLICDYGAEIGFDRSVRLSNAPLDIAVILLLRSLGRPAKPSELCEGLHSLFDIKISEQNLRGNLSRIYQVLIMGRGKYGLFEFLGCSMAETANIAERSFELLKSRDAYLSSKVIFERLKSDTRILFNLRNAYELHGVLSRDHRFVATRGFMVGLAQWAKGVPPSLGAQLDEIIEMKGPIAVKDIVTELSTNRIVEYVNVTSILESSQQYIRVEPSVYEKTDKVFGSREAFSNIQTMIHVILIAQPSTKRELARRLTQVPTVKFDENLLTEYLIGSITRKMDRVRESFGILRISPLEPEEQEYNLTVKDWIERSAKGATSQRELAEILPESKVRWLSYDFRLFGGEPPKPQPQCEQLESIVNAFLC